MKSGKDHDQQADVIMREKAPNIYHLLRAVEHGKLMFPFDLRPETEAQEARIRRPFLRGVSSFFDLQYVDYDEEVRDGAFGDLEDLIDYLPSDHCVFAMMNKQEDRREWRTAIVCSRRPNGDFELFTVMDTAVASPSKQNGTWLVNPASFQIKYGKFKVNILERIHPTFPQDEDYYHDNLASAVVVLERVLRGFRDRPTQLADSPKVGNTRKLRWSRDAAGYTPTSDIVRILDLSQARFVNTERNADTVGIGTPKRGHERRGHPRTLKSGKTIWIAKMKIKGGYMGNEGPVIVLKGLERTAETT